MARSTIDFGIDLGTTNSAVAVLNDSGGGTTVFRNNDGHEYTPSAVWIDPGGRVVVGRRAKERADVDEENTCLEFKLQMGTRTQFPFKRSGRTMTPEQLSAEVLKMLRETVNHRAGEQIEAAVITVPAAFELAQCEATSRAAKLAGLELAPLLQEPVAAAMAYGYQQETGGPTRFWLVYDFGGGTFDAAIVKLEDGQLQVVNHGGDNHLGGKLIDWAIVEKKLIPALARDRGFADVARGNPKWAAAVAKLKWAAEKAKIELSSDESTYVELELKDSSGALIEFNQQLQRTEIEDVMEPFVTRSINICKKVLTESRLGTSSIDRVLLVGGPTLTPYFRSRLSDPRTGLGIELEYRSDPLTVVARGAAVFAGTQRFGKPPPAATPETFAVQLEYAPMGAEVEPFVGGRVIADGGRSIAGYTVELVNAGPPRWSTGRIPLADDGVFDATLYAQKGRRNVFEIELYDPQGRRQEVDPRDFHYTVGIEAPKGILINSIGIALADGKVSLLLAKGTELPAKKQRIFRTTSDTTAGGSSDRIVVPIVEGENKRAERNRAAGTLTIHGTKISRNVPAGSEVEVMLYMSESRTLRASAFVPMLNEDFEVELNLATKEPDATSLQARFETSLKRLDEIGRRMVLTGDTRSAEILQRIEAENMLDEVRQSLAAARGDRDSADKCEKRLQELEVALDDAEEALAWPGQVSEAEEEIERARRQIDAAGTPTEKQDLARLEKEVRAAIQAHDLDTLKSRVTELGRVRFGVEQRDPGMWIGHLQYLESERERMSDRSQAERLITQGHRAIQANDLSGLQASVRQLISLLPTDRKDKFYIEGGLQEG